jgi:hypothetical protein
VWGGLYLQRIQLTGAEIERKDWCCERPLSLNLFFTQIRLICSPPSKDPNLFLLERTSNDRVAKKIEPKAMTVEMRSDR